MKTITMLEFRKNAEQIVQWALQGKRMIMTYRGKPVMRLEPITDQEPDDSDPFLLLDGIVSGKRESLSNEDIDGIVYSK